MRKRKAIPGEVFHVFQKTLDGGLIFYSDKDRLVFCTLCCSMARRKQVTLLGLYPQWDCIHLALKAPDMKWVSAFMQQYTRLFSMEWNSARGRKGPFFRHPFSCERFQGEWPLAQNVSLRKAAFRDPALQPMLQKVRAIHQAGGYVRYKQLNRWEELLSREQWQRLASYILSLWKVPYCRYSLEEEIRMEGYGQCIRMLLEEGIVQDTCQIPVLPAQQKAKVYRLLMVRTRVKPAIARKLLHLAP